MGDRKRRKPGDGVGKPAPSTLPFEEQSEAAREAALRLLTVRERSTVELRARLRQKGFLPDVIEGVLETLTAADLQSDQRFAARFAEGATARGLATRRIQNELRARGVGKDLAAQAATEDPGTERARALETALRRAARMTGLPTETRVRRLSAFLARRGYGPDLCRSVASQAAGVADLEDDVLDPDMEPDLP
jgi:regulatory protein